MVTRVSLPELIKIVKETFSSCSLCFSIDLGEEDFNKDFLDLGLDELDVLETVIFIEDEYNIVFSDNIEDTFKTPQDIVNYLKPIFVD